MATINIGELVTTTLRNRTGELADNITKHNALLVRLSKKGNIKPADGGREIDQELEYAENATVQWYSGYDTLDTTPQTVFDAATFDFKQLAGTVSISGLEEAQNSGKERVIPLLNSRIANLERSMRNQLAAALYSDGTVAKQIGGLKFLIADDPTTSTTVGGINQNTYSFWRNKTLVTGAPSGLTAAQIQQKFNSMWIQLIRGTDKPDSIVADANYYTAFENSLQQQQRFLGDADMAKLGFDSLAYKSASVFFDDQCPTNRCYFVNTDFLFLRPHKDRQFVPLDDRNSFNQDAKVIPTVWMGNLTCSNRKLQGVLKDS